MSEIVVNGQPEASIHAGEIAPIIDRSPDAARKLAGVSLTSDVGPLRDEALVYSVDYKGTRDEADR